MSFRSSITIVASPRPRVGKTLLARLLTDYHRSEGRTVAAFDLNSREPTLAQFLPEHTTSATVRDINGQMALFDRLVADETVTKVVDLGDNSFESFFAVAHKIGFVEEALRHSIGVAVLFTVTPDKTSVDGYRGLRDRFALATLVPVLNELLGSAQHRDKYPLARGGPLMIHLPVLAHGLRKYIDSPPFSFTSLNMEGSAGIPLDAQNELQRWMRRIHLEFRELDLRILLADLRASIQFGP